MPSGTSQIAFEDDVLNDSPGTRQHIERRAHPRLSLRRGANLLTPWNGKIIEVRTLDISFGGLGILSGISLPKYMRMICRINMLAADNSDQQPINVAVEAVSCIHSNALGGFKVGLVYRPANQSLINDAISRMR